MKKTILFLILTTILVSATATAVTTKRGDLNNNDIIDGNDIKILTDLTLGIGKVQDNTLAFCKADINSDRRINVLDVLYMKRRQVSGVCDLGGLILESPIIPIFPSPTPIQIKYFSGDADGDGMIYLNDVQTIMDYSAGLISMSDSWKCRADVNKDGQISVIDGLLTGRMIYGIIPTQFMLC